MTKLKSVQKYCPRYRVTTAPTIRIPKISFEFITGESTRPFGVKQNFTYSRSKTKKSVDLYRFLIAEGQRSVQKNNQSVLAPIIMGVMLSSF